MPKNGRAGAWPRAGRARCRRPRSITSGRTTSCSTPAPTAGPLKCLTVIDEFTRECLAIDVAGGIRSGRVIEVLTQLVSVTARRAICARTMARSLSPAAILRWLQTAQIETALIDPGQALAEWHRRIVQREVPQRVFSLQWFRNRVEAKVGIEAMAASLQRGSAALEPWLSDAAGVQSETPVRLSMSRRGARRLRRLAPVMKSKNDERNSTR